MARKRAGQSSGKLRIGNDWNAISIIALAQSNPLKAVAEFVENSIDAGARRVTIVRGRERGEPYLAISDDGAGIRRTSDGEPDFRHVATHICDSMKRNLKAHGATGIQGEYGIGLLSFWTLGETLYMTSAGNDGRNYQMRLDRDDPSYHVQRLRTLVPCEGTEIQIKPLLPGIRQLAGEKIEWYLASELRDRIRMSGLQITVIDRQARKQYQVIPRKFDGELLHNLPSLPTPNGDIYLELYLAQTGTGSVGLYRSGTRVLVDLSELDDLANSVWTSGAVEGIVDAPFLTLTPGTRSGLIRDGAFRTFMVALEPVTKHLERLAEEHSRAEEERASERMFKRLRRAFREALLALPTEDYDWFEINKTVPAATSRRTGVEAVAGPAEQQPNGSELPVADDKAQRSFFDFPGPLHSVRISPVSSVARVNTRHTLHAVCRDKSRRAVTAGLSFRWRVLEGTAELPAATGEVMEFVAPAEPEALRLGVTVTQNELSCDAEATVTVTDELLPDRAGVRSARAHGLPGYTFEHTPAALWRSRYELEPNVIVINNGHRDFIYANRNTTLKLRYIARLYAKELVQKNFPGVSGPELLERMIELTLYMEDNLR